jgi:hypothetical protein
MTMTPAKLRKACDKVGGVYAMARLFGKGVSLHRFAGTKLKMQGGSPTNSDGLSEGRVGQRKA